MAVEWQEIGNEETPGADGVVFFRFSKIGDQAIGKITNVKEGIEGKYGPETHYFFSNPSGDFKVNPPADLKKRLKAAAIGDTVRMTQVGSKDIGKQNPMGLFKVERAKGGSSTPAQTKQAESDF